MHRDGFHGMHDVHHFVILEDLCGIAITCGLVAIEGASAAPTGAFGSERNILIHEVAAGDHSVGKSSCPISSNALPDGSDEITTSIGRSPIVGVVPSKRQASPRAPRSCSSS